MQSRNRNAEIDKATNLIHIPFYLYGNAICVLYIKIKFSIELFVSNITHKSILIKILFIDKNIEHSLIHA